MTEYTREGLLALAESLVANLQPPPPVEPASAPAFNTRAARLTMNDVSVPIGATEVRVPITLDQPANQTMLFRVLTENQTAKEGPQFQRVDQWISFEPGETAKIVTVPLTGSIAGLWFRLKCIHVQGWDGTAIPSVADGNANIYGAGLAVPALVKTEARSFGLTKKPTGLALAFEETFDQATFAATDTGYLADGVTPCWRTCMGNGDRFWPGNGTIGVAVDPVVHPGTAPWVWHNGRFNLQSEYIAANPITHVQGSITRTFNYTMPFLTTQRHPVAGQIGVGDYVEGRMAIPSTVGSWPAFWLLGQGSGWPRNGEFDIFEAFNGTGGASPLARIGTTVWWYDNGNKSYGIKLPHLGIDPAAMNTWGMYWGENLMTYFINNQPYFAVPNIWPTKKAYLKLDIAVGGQGGTPDPLNWPVRMPTEWVRIWR